MVKTDKLLKYVGIAALVYFISTKIGNEVLAKISYGRPKVRVNSANVTGVNIIITLPITNNSGISIPVQSVQAEIMYGSNVLSTVSANSQFTISANNTTDVSFNAVIDYAQLSGSIANIIDTQEWLQALKLKGYAATGGVIFPFEETFSIG